MSPESTITRGKEKEKERKRNLIVQVCLSRDVP
jgi:hypothetical protein